MREAHSFLASVSLSAITLHNLIHPIQKTASIHMIVCPVACNVAEVPTGRLVMYLNSLQEDFCYVGELY